MKIQSRNDIEKALKNLLDSEFSFHESIIFHESHGKLFITLIDENEKIFQFTGIFLTLMKTIFLSRGRPLKNWEIFLDSFNETEKSEINSHPEEFKQILAGLFSFIIEKKFVEMKSLPDPLTIQSCALEQIYKVGKLEGKMHLVDGQTYKGAEFTEDHLTVYAVSSMTACTGCY